MIQPPPPYNLRPMQVSDITQVMMIERETFPTPWPAHAYQYELTRNDLAHCYALEVKDQLIGYACLWLIVDEIHISTLAVAQAWRGRGLGELLLLVLLKEGMALNGQSATLEVRVSNQVAQTMYAKFGFVVAGRRKRYYPDNHEDALIMTVEPLDAAFQARLEAHQAALFSRLGAQH